MPQPTKYLLVALPTSISPSNDSDEALTALRSTVTFDYGTTYPFPVPSFKIGTLDALVQQAEDLSKLAGTCEGVAGKVGESLAGILEGDREKIEQHKVVNDKPIEHYLQSFHWNKVKYRTDKAIGDLVDSLHREIGGIDNDVKSKFNQYNQVKQNLQAQQRKQIGNLATRSLLSVVSPRDVIQDSEYLETHLIAVPSQAVKDFHNSYEHLAPMVVPRSANPISSDSDFVLFAVTTFKKHSAEFVHKCRESKWTPRDFKMTEGGAQEEEQELERLRKEERKVWGECLRMGRAGWSDAAMIWVHALALRVFVESVLRYGLPVRIVSGIVKASQIHSYHSYSISYEQWETEVADYQVAQTTPKLAKRAKNNLDNNYSYLGGNAFSRDKKGRATKDDSSTSSDMQALGHQGEDYTAYVYYEFEIN